MKRLHAGMGMALVGLLALALAAPAQQEAVAETEKPKIVLGTFDSRAVAVAWAHTDTFKERIRGMHQELEKAKAAGDEERVAELEAAGPALQHQMHLQGFCGTSVANILKEIEGELPGIAKEAGVDVIVSKWDLAYRTPAAKAVDVTNLLVSRFSPNDDVWETVKQMRDIDPVDPETFEDHDH